MRRGRASGGGDSYPEGHLEGHLICVAVEKQLKALGRGVIRRGTWRVLHPR